MWKAILFLVFIFVMRIIFNVYLPSFDIYSDITLSYKTFTFRLGDSLLLAGCRVCQGKDETEIYTLKNKSCQQCLTSNFPGGNLFCGNSREFLDIIHEHERKDTCNNEHFSLTLNFNSTTRSNILKNEKCDVSKDQCCLENKNGKNISSLFDPSGKSFFAYPTGLMGYESNKMIYNTYVLSGKFSMVFCHSVFTQYFTTTRQTFYAFVNKNITTIKSPEKTELYMKFRKLRNGKLLLENGHTDEDGCGILFQDKQDDNANFIGTENDGLCGLNSCLIHLQTLRWYANISSLDEWKYKTFYDQGTKVGGKTCQLLWIYGIAMLVPVFLSMIFYSFVFFEDLNNGQASMMEIVFLPLLWYPQWKTFRIMGTFIYDKNRENFDEANAKFDSEVGTLEPFLESAIQVS